MKKINDGGPAFPRNGHPDKNDLPSIGMSLRDYFAAKAMQGILSNSEVEKFRQSLDKNIPDSKQIEAITLLSYEIADAMLKAREKNE